MAFFHDSHRNYYYSAAYGLPGDDLEITVYDLRGQFDFWVGIFRLLTVLEVLVLIATVVLLLLPIAFEQKEIFLIAQALINVIMVGGLLALGYSRVRLDHINLKRFTGERTGSAYVYGFFLALGMSEILGLMAVQVYWLAAVIGACTIFVAARAATWLYRVRSPA